MAIIDGISRNSGLLGGLSIDSLRRDPLKRKRSSLKKMYQHENNLIRPRKIQGFWSENLNNPGRLYPRSQLFNVSENCYKNNAENDSRRSIEKKITKQSFGKKIMQFLDNYCQHSSLHGLHYIGDNRLSIYERLFWLLAFTSALAFASYYISNIYLKWTNSPVIVSFSPVDATFRDIPFPSITLCNMNQAKRSEAERILNSGSTDEKNLLYDYCSSNNSFNGSSNQGPDWRSLQKFLVKVGQPCSEMLKACYWKSDSISCEDSFNNELTDEGLCCSFNRLPPALIFRNLKDLAILNQTYPANVIDWTPETGFPESEIVDETSIPRRPAGAGSHLGLTIIADARIEEYFCSSTDSIGFKVLIGNPIETPKMAHYSYLTTPGTEVRYRIFPEVRDATDALRHISIKNRQCYFSNERPLYYYRTYTARNCRLECQSNYTYSKCQCIPHYLPKNTSIKTCGKSDQACSDQAREEMELTFGNAKNMVVMHFFFQDSRFRKTIKGELYGFTDVLANVGGLLGLCLGFSFLSLIELIYFIIIRFIGKSLTKIKCKWIQLKPTGGIGRHDGQIMPFIK